MVFSRLLLATTNSKSYIIGAKKDDKLIVQVQSDELALCFQIDDSERQTSRILDLNENDQRCDGLIFYAKNGQEQKVICLVEMKSTNIDTVASQIKATKYHIEEMLRQECGSHFSRLRDKILWKAGFYSYGASDDRKLQKIYGDLKKAGFADVHRFDEARDDATSFLRGDINAKNMKKKFKSR